MIFENYTLKSPLTNYIESIFYYKDFCPDHTIERVVPTGHLFIIFDLKGFQYHTYDSNSLEPNGDFNNVWISGMHKEYLSISAHQNSEMLVIQFKANGAYPFLHIPVSRLNNKVVNAVEIFGQEILQLRNNVINAEAVSVKFDLIKQWLDRRCNVKDTSSPAVQEVLSKIKNSPITDSVDIIKSYPYSQKDLIAKFKKYCGLTPKVLHRIYRFNEILLRIQSKERLLWSDIAYEFGYTDQSHFIKEFREFSGFNPQEFIEKEYHKDEPNFFPLDRNG